MIFKKYICIISLSTFLLTSCNSTPIAQESTITVLPANTESFVQADTSTDTPSEEMVSSEEVLTSMEFVASMGTGWNLGQ